MPWRYSQSTGELKLNGRTVATGYSGLGAGRNNPQMQTARGVGPIPVGAYTIGASFHHPHAGGHAMRLTPAAGTNTYGRDGFMIHGDSARHPGQASEGCIIENLNARQQISNSRDTALTMVP